jgi:hypothetical protein
MKMAFMELEFEADYSAVARREIDACVTVAPILRNDVFNRFFRPQQLIPREDALPPLNSELHKNINEPILSLLAPCGKTRDTRSVST